jgi:hypothetical protein
MKRFGNWVLAALGVVLAGVASDVAWAQGGPRPAAGPGVVVGPGAPAERRVLLIRKMPKLRKVKQPTPIYTSSATTQRPGRPREWGVFEVTYDTVPEWMDEVVATFYLMSEHRLADGKKEYSFYQTTVRYTDVARGEHTACVVLPPGAVARYGDAFIGMAVEFSSADGKPLDAKSEVEGTLIQDWWKKPEVTDKLNKREGLVDRSRTPFGLINIDDYEAVK